MENKKEDFNLKEEYIKLGKNPEDIKEVFTFLAEFSKPMTKESILDGAAWIKEQREKEGLSEESTNKAMAKYISERTPGDKSIFYMTRDGKDIQITGVFLSQLDDFCENHTLVAWASQIPEVKKKYTIVSMISEMSETLDAAKVAS